MEVESEESEDWILPECPYCGVNLGNCEHVLLDYDASFGEYMDGLIELIDDEIKLLQAAILKLIKASRKPALKDDYLKAIWDYALENYKPGSEYIEFDRTAYFNLLAELIGSFDGEAIQYSDEASAPGNSSSYIMFFASEPEECLENMNKYILKQLRKK